MGWGPHGRLVPSSEEEDAGDPPPPRQHRRLQQEVCKPVRAPHQNQSTPPPRSWAAGLQHGET